MQWYLLCLLVILLAIIGFIVFVYKSHLSNMLGMCTAMAIGMMIGLSSGVVLGILFSDAFFETTIISMFIGALLGVLFGYPFSLIAVVDGFISGLMGGMMGTMLAVMVPTQHHLPLTQVMLLLLVGTLFILYLALAQEIKNNTQKTLSLKTIWYFLFICASFICIHFIEAPSLAPNEDPHSNHHHAIKTTDHLDIF
ncbi:hypothetical protein RYX45_07345 [Alkalihalophilus pseudofirmus]|uniref:Uncharacterized protein n=1 Tax=Alkalihalophilus pseudofirmus TaxID=79885 RepID=A0AAJ2NMS5_ALKPS|nr:hypothetical protein [Alkalihalophilus pseudofirmus]MDV2884990.1 hypothetical protein [Alkalihalophilus pseudofirmus]